MLKRRIRFLYSILFTICLVFLITGCGGMKPSKLDYTFIFMSSGSMHMPGVIVPIENDLTFRIYDSIYKMDNGKLYLDSFRESIQRGTNPATEFYFHDLKSLNTDKTYMVQVNGVDVSGPNMVDYLQTEHENPIGIGFGIGLKDSLPVNYLNTDCKADMEKDIKTIEVEGNNQTYKKVGSASFSCSDPKWEYLVTFSNYKYEVMDNAEGFTGVEVNVKVK